MTKESLMYILAGYYKCSKKRFENKSSRQLVDEYLRFNGIIGYTNDIIEVIEAAYDIKLDTLEAN